MGKRETVQLRLGGRTDRFLLNVGWLRSAVQLLLSSRSVGDCHERP